jgi:hypothetical protein
MTAAHTAFIAPALRRRDIRAGEMGKTNLQSISRSDSTQLFARSPHMQGVL